MIGNVREEWQAARAEDRPMQPVAHGVGQAMFAVGLGREMDRQIKIAGERHGAGRNPHPDPAMTAGRRIPPEIDQPSDTQRSGQDRPAPRRGVEIVRCSAVEHGQL